MRSYWTITLIGAALVAFMVPEPAHAWKPAKIDAAADEALQTFFEDVDGGDELIQKSVGYLIFPKVYKAGLGIGGETGEGVLRAGGAALDYYRTTAGSFGFQAGAQAKSILIIFMTEKALSDFHSSKGWKVGVDGSVALVDIGAGKAVDTDNFRDPVVGFIFGSTGLMYNLTLEGSKFSKLNPDKRED